LEKIGVFHGLKDYNSRPKKLNGYPFKTAKSQKIYALPMKYRMAHNFSQTFVSMIDGYFARKDCLDVYLGVLWLPIYLGVSEKKRMQAKKA